MNPPMTYSKAGIRLTESDALARYYEQAFDRLWDWVSAHEPQYQKSITEDEK